jgi:hypothetical protein
MEITVRELIELLRKEKQDSTVEFGGGGLTFYRVKTRGSNTVQIEFNESVYRDKSGRLRAEG